MKHKTVEYKGHTIEAEIRQVRSGFAWSYTIDGASYRESTARPMRSEQAMLQEAIDAARAQVDNLRDA